MKQITASQIDTATFQSAMTTTKFIRLAPDYLKWITYPGEHMAEGTDEEADEVMDNLREDGYKCVAAEWA